MLVPRNNHNHNDDDDDANQCRRPGKSFRRRRFRKPMGTVSSSLIVCASGLAVLFSIVVSLVNRHHHHHLDGIAVAAARIEATNGSLIPGVEAFGVSPWTLSRNPRSSTRISVPLRFDRRALAVRLPPRCWTASATDLAAKRAQAKTERSSSNEDAATLPGVTYTYQIRDCQYRELTSVASLVVSSFYNKKKINLIACKLYQLAEMNRLQQNFPYPESRSVHRMLVVEATATATTTNTNAEGTQTSTSTGEETISSPEPTIVGFCDVDTRPCSTKLKLPRPYLSDLAIDPNHRRKGLARMLVEASEEFVSGTTSGTKEGPFGELWIRVASDNDAALGLYQGKLRYSLAEWTTGEEPKPKPKENNKTEDEPEIWTLRKDLRSE
jgi:ribosomal protein S18 acetylase RimI-like enzyme